MDEPFQTLGRIRAMVGDLDMPEPFQLYADQPKFLTDFYMNFRRFVWDDGHLDPKTKAMIAFAVAAHLQCKAWALWFEIVRLPMLGMSNGTGDAIRALVASVSMHNAYFKGLAFSRITLEGKTHGLRSHAISSTPIDNKATELIGTVISALNSCHGCTAGHSVSALGCGATDLMIQEAFQCAATMVAGCTYLNSL